MNKIISAGILALLLLSSMAAARQTVVTKANEMKIDLLRYDPAPVQPGDTTDVWFEVINLKDAAINNFDVTFVEDYPFKLVSDKTVYFNRLGPGEKIQFKFTVEVNKNALESDNNVFIQYNSRQAGVITSEPFIVSVKRLGSIVSTSVGVSPAEDTVAMIAPGAVANIEVSIKNSEDSVMKNVRVTLDLTSTSMPFAPVGMTAEQRLRQVNPGSSSSVVYKLVALPDAAAGVYKVPITISYYDDVGTLHETEDLVGIMVGAEPKLKVVLDSTELTKSKKNGNIVLKIVNYGTTDVKFARLNVVPGDDYELISTEEHYIGNIDSDDYETVEFRVNAKANEMAMPVQLEYMDANNIKYSEMQNVGIMLYSPSDLGLSNGSAWIYVVVLLVVGGAYYGYRKYKSRKQR